MNETLTVFKWFWSDQDQEQEAWLGEMAQRGLHLQDVELLCRYTFASGPAAASVYRMDTRDKAKRADYLQLMEDAGWELVTTSDTWAYWRHSAAQGRQLAIFTDVESKLAQYKRVLLLQLGSLVAAPAGLLGVATSTTMSVSVKAWFAAFFVPALAFHLYRMLRLKRRIGQMRAS